MFASIMVVLGAIVLCLFFLNGGGYVTRDLDVVATVSLPKDWAERAPERHPSLVAFPFVKTEFRWWGAGDPHEVEAWVVIGAPNCSTAEIEAGMMRAFRPCRAGRSGFQSSVATNMATGRSGSPRGDIRSILCTIRRR